MQFNAFKSMTRTFSQLSAKTPPTHLSTNPPLIIDDKLSFLKSSNFFWDTSVRTFDVDRKQLKTFAKLGIQVHKIKMMSEDILTSLINTNRERIKKISTESLAGKLLTQFDRLEDSQVKLNYIPNNSHDIEVLHSRFKIMVGLNVHQWMKTGKVDAEYEQLSLSDYNFDVLVKKNLSGDEVCFYLIDLQVVHNLYFLKEVLLRGHTQRILQPEESYNQSQLMKVYVLYAVGRYKDLENDLQLLFSSPAVALEKMFDKVHINPSYIVYSVNNLV